MNLLSIFSRKPANPAPTVIERRQYKPLKGELAKWYEYEYRPQRMQKRSPATCRNYEIALRAFSRQLGRDAKIGDLNDQALAEFLKSRVEKISYRTAMRDLDCLHALATFAWQTDLLEARPARTAHQRREIGGAV